MQSFWISLCKKIKRSTRIDQFEPSELHCIKSKPKNEQRQDQRKDQRKRAMKSPTKSRKQTIS